MKEHFVWWIKITSWIENCLRRLNWGLSNIMVKLLLRLKWFITDFWSGHMSTETFWTLVKTTTPEINNTIHDLMIGSIVLMLRKIAGAVTIWSELVHNILFQHLKMRSSQQDMQRLLTVNKKRGIVSVPKRKIIFMKTWVANIRSL